MRSPIPRIFELGRQEMRKIETQSLPSQLYLLSRKSLSSIPAFLIEYSKIPRQAAGKRTTFFLLPLVMFVGGTKVTSTYFLAQATRSRLQLRSSLCLMFSRWLSMVLTLRLSEFAIWLFPGLRLTKRRCASRGRIIFQCQSWDAPSAVVVLIASRAIF